VTRFRCSGAECVKILCNKFGFSVSRQRGSHVVLIKIEEEKSRRLFHYIVEWQ